ncbi:MAG: YihY/virulence factor BrkB family protein [Pseudomonadota bacterium]
MNPISPESPEARARQGGRTTGESDRRFAQLRPGGKAFEVLKRVGIGVYSDGFIHAGNLAFLALMTLFPFFIVAAAIASVFGQDAETLRAVGSFLATLPPDVGKLLRQPILDVLAARTGSLLWLGALVGLWTVGSFIETIRDVFRRAYGTEFSQPFWRYRLGSVLVIVGSVVLALVSFLVQGLLTAVEQFVYRLLPFAEGAAGWIGLSRLIPAAVMFGALYLLFYSVTPGKYRYGKCPKWPGALLTTIWWLGSTALLPVVLAQLGGYDLTYGSLAGVIVALYFFFIIGLGISMAAQLNAALAEGGVPDVRESPATGATPAAA